MSLDPNGQSMRLTVPKGTFCGGGDCTIISGMVGLQFEDGTPADVSKGVYIHHILASNTNKRVEPFVSSCDTSGDVQTIRRPAPVAAGFVGGSDDNINDPTVYGTRDGSIEGGYWLGKGESLAVTADLVNLEKKEKTVYVTYDLEYVPGHVGADALGSLISVTGCGGRRIATPASGPANTTSGKFRFFRNGHLVNGSMYIRLSSAYIPPRTVLFANRQNQRDTFTMEVLQWISTSMENTPAHPMPSTVATAPLQFKTGKNGRQFLE
jgi:hypothetical protein